MYINTSSILRKRYRECTCAGGLSHGLLGILPRPLGSCVVVCSISERDGTSRVCRSSGVSRAVHRTKAESQERVQHFDVLSPSITSPGETASRLSSELKGESRVDDVVVIAVLFAH